MGVNKELVVFKIADMKSKRLGEFFYIIFCLKCLKNNLNFKQLKQKV